MIKIININSEVQIKKVVNEINLINGLGFLVHKARVIPVYHVDEKLMDLIYPLIKKRIVNEKKVKSLLEHPEVPHYVIHFEEIWTDKYDPDNIMITVGLYCHSKFNDDKNNEIKNLLCDTKNSFNVDNIEFPAIFICCERVVNWAKKLSIKAEVIYRMIYYHELGHAYIYSQNRDSYKYYYRIIEESYCNAVSLSRFLDMKESSCVIKAIDSQPGEYRGYTFFHPYENKFIYRPKLKITGKELAELLEISKYYYKHYFFDSIKNFMKNINILGLSQYVNIDIFDFQNFKTLWRSNVDEDFFMKLALNILKEIYE